MDARLRPIRAALIDLDGTLVDTLGEIMTAANAMLVDAGRPAVDAATVAGTVGEGAAILVDHLMGHGHAERWLPVYLARYRAINATTATLYPGVSDGLAAMKAAGIAIACVTNKPRELVDPLLAHLGIADHFDAIVGGGDTPLKKPSPQPLLLACETMGVPIDASVMIGDSINDARAARAAGALSWTLPYGYPGIEGDEGRAAALLRRGLTDAVVDDLMDAARRMASTR